MKKVIFTIFVFLLFISNTYAFDLSSKRAVLYNLNDNSIVYDLKKDEKTSIASLTKIMTVLVSVEHIDNLDNKITITKDMLKGLIENNLYVAGLKEGQVVTYRDLLYVTLLPSGADGAQSLSILVGGSIDNFVKMMNDKAQELGLSHTHFANPTGLDNEENYSTVDEVAHLLMEAIKNDDFYEVFKTSEYTLSDNSMTVQSSLRHNANTYKINVPYIIGSKTGYTNNAGKCLASIAYDKDNDITYLLITTNASTSPKDAYHVEDAKTIYSYYMNNYSYKTFISKDDTVISLPTKYSILKNIDIKLDDDLKYYFNNDFDKDKVIIKYEGIDTLKPTNKVNDKIGEVTILYDNEEIGKKDLYLNNTIPYSFIGFVIIHKGIIIIVLLILCLALLNLIRLRYKYLVLKQKIQ